MDKTLEVKLDLILGQQEKLLGMLAKLSDKVDLNHERMQANILAIGADVAILVVRSGSNTERIAKLEARVEQLEKVKAA